MKDTGRREFNKSVKRGVIFISIFAVFAIVISTLLILYTDIPQWLNGLIIILIASVCYLIYYFVCVRIDKKKEERVKESLKKKDPFAD